MKLRWWYGIAVNLILAALVVTGAAVYTVHSRSKNQFLEIRDTNSGKLYGKWPFKEADEFAVEFIHSVHQSPVRENFKIEDKMIQPMTVRFSSFGAGMQSELEEGQVLSREGDDLLISGFVSSFRELNYIVGTVSDHVLFINGNMVSLQELCGKNAHITIRTGGKKK
ncbi:MAG: DUF1850 domain-containing protein [Treponema sp.]|nr:DUF1850 domain-containing protein [Treponema sp.]